MRISASTVATLGLDLSQWSVEFTFDDEGIR